MSNIISFRGECTEEINSDDCSDYWGWAHSKLLGLGATNAKN